MSIKRIDPKATFDIVSVYDEAIQHENMEELEELKKTKGQTRFEKYLETFNLEELKLVEGQSPTLFKVRCLLASEKADLDEKHQSFDMANKRIEYKNRHAMMLEMFKKACLGIVNESGGLDKVGIDDIEYKVATDIGAAISILGSIGKNLKKV